MEHMLSMIVAAIVAIPLWLVLVVFTERCVRLYRRLRPPFVVTCPATQTPAALTLQSSPSTMESSTGMTGQRVERCSRWPEHAPCDQACLQRG